jgi:hypothetical protein
MLQEALERGLRVSVLVRNRAKLEAELRKETLARLSKITVGDGTHAKVLDEAVPGIDVVRSGRGADPYLARELAAAVERHGVKKLCWPAGSTNVMAADGVTSNYKRLLHLGGWVEGAHRTHGACIDAIREAGINYVILCPGLTNEERRQEEPRRAFVRANQPRRRPLRFVRARGMGDARSRHHDHLRPPAHQRRDETLSYTQDKGREMCS